jgi:hypothetical protein
MNAAPEFAPVSAPDYASADMIDSSSPSSSSSSMSSLLLRALFIIILLALIGFNVFTYLDDITQWFSDTFGAPFRSVARFLGYAAADTVKTTVDVTAKGAKSTVDIAAGATTSGIDVLQKTIGGGGEGIKANNTPSTNASSSTSTSTSTRSSTSTSTNASNTNTNHPYQAESTLENALSHAKQAPPQPDDATSRTQRSSGKAGYCYIGEDRGFRSCLKVGEQDTCMSGDIFPTHAICINPRLRQ